MSDRPSRIAVAYRRLGLGPVTVMQKHASPSRAFAKQRRKIIARDHRLAIKASRSRQKPASSNEKPFPFMQLPPELRNRIYQFALTEPRRQHLESLITPPLACTSSQVRKECLPVFLRVNSFQTYFSKNPDGSFGIIFSNETLPWLLSLPLNTKLIKDLRISFEGDLVDRNGSKSTAFQLVTRGLQTSVNHFEPECAFCIDGWYGENFVLPHPFYDHPSFGELSQLTLRVKAHHDKMIDGVAEAYFRTSEDWGRGGLSISEIIDLAVAASAIKSEPAYLRTLSRFTDDMAGIITHATAQLAIEQLAGIAASLVNGESDVAIIVRQNVPDADFRSRDTDLEHSRPHLGRKEGFQALKSGPF